MDNKDGDFSRDELLGLLAELEGELQARDEVIERLKNRIERTNLKFVKNGSVWGSRDAVVALYRDGLLADDEFERFCFFQIYCEHAKALKDVAKKTKDASRHLQGVVETSSNASLDVICHLQKQMENESKYASQGDDVVALLERERNKLQQEVEFQNQVALKCQEEKEALERKFEEEKQRHQAIVLYLINERKEMLLKLQQHRLKSETQATCNTAQLVEQLKKEVVFLRSERDDLKKNNKTLQADNLSYKEVIKSQENDLLLLRKNLLPSAKVSNDKAHTMLPHLADERSFVVVNRSAALTRISNSNSFPSTSRLPRAPASPTTRTPRLTMSPPKKTPTMGIVSSTVRARQANAEQYNENVANNVASNSLPKSASSESQSSAVKSEAPPRPAKPPPSSSESLRSKIASQGSGTVKRNGIAMLGRAFGSPK